MESRAEQVQMTPAGLNDWYSAAENEKIAELQGR
jgi:hypothetical protein